MPQVDTNGIKIEYRFDGREGAPYITFVTGIANDLTMWDTQVEALGKDYRTLRYDLRGHGDTLATEGDYSMELLVRDLADDRPEPLPGGRETQGESDRCLPHTTLAGDEDKPLFEKGRDRPQVM